MSTQYRLVQSGKTASGGCSAGPRFVRAVAPRIIIIIIIMLFFACILYALHLFSIPVLLFRIVSTLVLFLFYILLVRCSDELFLLSYVLFAVDITRVFYIVMCGNSGSYSTM
jgi:hypothetical protein